MDPPFVHIHEANVRIKTIFQRFFFGEFLFWNEFTSLKLTREIIQRIPLVNSCCGTQGLWSLTCIYNMLLFQGPRDNFFKDETNVHQRPAFAEFWFRILLDVYFVGSDRCFLNICKYIYVYRSLCCTSSHLHRKHKHTYSWMIHWTTSVEGKWFVYVCVCSWHFNLKHAGLLLHLEDKDSVCTRFPVVLAGYFKLSLLGVGCVTLV